MLILEGADCLGKTTLANRLIKSLSCLGIKIGYSHMSRPDENLFDFLYDYFPMMKQTVQDRFHLGGIVWHEDKISKENLVRIENQLYSHHNAMIIVVYTSNIDWYKAQLKADNRDQMFDDTKLLAANEVYRNIAKGTHPLQPQVDLAMDVKDAQWPSDVLVNNIARAYSNRLMEDTVC